MIVIYYQLLIVATILAVHFVWPRFLLHVCWVWTAFTLINLFFPPLIAIQLGVIWSTFFLLKKYASKTKKIKFLQDDRSKLDTRSRETLRNSKSSEQSLITGIEHSQKLDKALKEAESSVCIVSGWINDYVLDSKRLTLIENLLRRGCSIYIGYGWEDSSGNHREHLTTNKAETELTKLDSSFPDKLFFAKYPTHEKILAVDGKYLIVTSHNWLSNMKFRNKETGVLISNPELARSEGNRIKKEVLANTQIPF